MLDREKLMLSVACRFGQESEVTRWFCYYCESSPKGSLPDAMVQMAYDITMKSYADME